MKVVKVKSLQDCEEVLKDDPLDKLEALLVIRDKAQDPSAHTLRQCISRFNAAIVILESGDAEELCQPQHIQHLKESVQSLQGEVEQWVQCYR
jgi:hypothetical protein